MTINFGRIVSVVVASAALAGCASQKAERASETLEERYAALSPDRPEPRTTAAPRRLVPILPSLADRGGRVTSRVDGELQTTRTVFAPPSRGLPANYLEAVTAESEAALLRQDGKPTETIVRQALANEFPGAKMLIVTTPRTNGYGPYGLALGVLPSGDRCAYAWQWVEPGRSQAGGAANLRGRICARGQTLDQMAQLFDRLELRPEAAAPRRAPQVRRAATKRVAARPRPAAAIAPTAAPAIAADAPHYIVPVDAASLSPAAAPRPAGSDLAPAEARPAVSLPAEALRGPSRSGAPRKPPAIPGPA